MGACKDNEMCVATSVKAKKGKCVCMTGAVYSVGAAKCIMAVFNTTDVPVFPYPGKLTNNVMVYFFSYRCVLYGK